MLRFLPNALTILRLLLALPVGLLILRQEFAWALAVGFFAGLTDALDGLAARRLGVFSRVGALLDPIADKLLITVIFFSLAFVGLIPMVLALLVLFRDLVIVGGAISYRVLIGELEMAPTQLSKWNTFLQISFCVMVLVAQLLPAFPGWAIYSGIVIVVLLAIGTGVDYVRTWAKKAVSDYRDRDAM